MSILTQKDQQREWDAAYQRGFQCLKAGEVCPPCLTCQGKMEPWDAWLVTGATCTQCGWNMSEGSGSLL